MTEAGPLLRITGKHLTALLQLNKHDHVWWAAPAIRKLERRSLKDVLAYCEMYHYKLEREVQGTNPPFSVHWEEVRATEPA